MGANLLTSRQAAEWLGIKDNWLRQMRVKGVGPRFTRLGTRSIRYRTEDLNAYVEAGAAYSTSEKASA